MSIYIYMYKLHNDFFLNNCNEKIQKHMYTMTNN